MRKASLIVMSALLAGGVGFAVWLIDTWQKILGRAK